LVVTRQAIKNEIDRVREEYLGVLLTIVKAFEQPEDPGAKGLAAQSDPEEWRSFLAETYGSTAESALERGSQGSFELRDPLR
jgi:hypothetical protein